MANLLHRIGGLGPDEDGSAARRAATCRCWDFGRWRLDAVGAAGEEGELQAVGRPGGMRGGARAGLAARRVADGVWREDAVGRGRLGRLGRRDAGEVQLGAALSVEGLGYGCCRRARWRRRLARGRGQRIEERGDARIGRAGGRGWSWLRDLRVDGEVHAEYGCYGEDGDGRRNDASAQPCGKASMDARSSAVCRWAFLSHPCDETAKMGHLAKY